MGGTDRPTLEERLRSSRVSAKGEARAPRDFESDEIPVRGHKEKNTSYES